MPAQYTNGIPANLEAAANDALAWLEFFAEKAAHGKCQITDGNLAKLGQAIGLLRQFLPDAAPVFEETEGETAQDFEEEQKT